MRLSSTAGMLLAVSIFTSAGLRAQNPIRAGAGKAEVVLPAEAFPLEGFNAQHDPMMVRTLLLDDGQKKLGIVVADQTSLSSVAIDRFKTMVSQTAKLPAGNIVIVAEHGFSTPHMMLRPDADDAARQREQLLEHQFDLAVRQSAEAAQAAMQAARLSSGCGASQVSVNRDVPTVHGWWLGANDAAFSDTALCELRADSLDGKPLAVVMNYAVQSAVMDGSHTAKGDRIVSADLAGAATRLVEERLGNGAVALFLIGAAGDQVPFLQANRNVVANDGTVSRIDLHEEGFDLLALEGERFGVDALRVAGSLQPLQAPRLNLERMSVRVGTQQPSMGLPTGPVTSYEYKPVAEEDAPAVFLTIGDLVIVGVPAELSAKTGALIREASPYANTMVATMVDGAAKYMVDAASYDRFTYEARNSHFAKGSAEKLVGFIGAQLQKMHQVK